MAARVVTRTGWARLVSTDLSNLCPPLSRGVASCLAADTRSGLPHFISIRRQGIMSNMPIQLVEGTSALVPLEQIEEEFAKDKWDARLIPGLRYAPHTTNYYIDFQRVPDIFRPAIKEYIKWRLATGVTVSTLHRCAYCLGNFLTFFLQQYPHAQTLQALCKQDIDTFLMVLKAEAEAHGWKDNQRIRHHLFDLQDWLCYLERIQSPLRPTEPTACIILPSHYPRHNYHRYA